jgi:hypothetical protein
LPIPASASFERQAFGQRDVGRYRIDADTARCQFERRGLGVLMTSALAAAYAA